MIAFLIIFAILAIASFFVCNSIVKSYTPKQGEEDSTWSKKKREKFNKLKRILPCAFVVIMILAFILSGIQIIDSTEVGVVRRFGEIDHQIDAGLNIINPISDTVNTYDLRVHVREAEFASYTKDAQPITSSIEYQYAIDPAYVMNIAREYGSYEILETKLCNVVEERAKIVFSQYSAMPLLENRSILSSQVAEEVKGLEDLFHVKFTSVIVRDIDFSDAFEASVEAKMTAEQDALRAEQEKKTAVVKAEQAAEVAAIQAQQKVIEAQAEADALAITRDALKNMPSNWIAQQWIQKWDGKLPTYMLSDDSAIMVTP